MSTHAFVQHLQQLYAHTQRDAAHCLPPGCTQLRLLHEDELTTWFVQFCYCKDNHKDELYVSLKLCFSDCETESCSLAHNAISTHHGSVVYVRMPLIFVIAPRLQAAFIHHGALCALELLSHRLPLTAEALCALLAALYRTLDPYSADSEVSVGEAAHLAGEQRNAYTAEEHDDGLRFIQHAHPYLFRNLNIDASKANSKVETPAAVGVAHSVVVRHVADLHDAAMRTLHHQLPAAEAESAGQGVELLLDLPSLMRDDGDALADKTDLAALQAELQQCISNEKQQRVRVLPLALPTLHTEEGAHNTNTTTSIRIAACEAADDAAHDTTRVVFAVYHASGKAQALCVCPPHTSYTFEGLTLYGHWDIPYSDCTVRFVRCTLWGTVRAQGTARVLLHDCNVLLDPRQGNVQLRHAEEDTEEERREGVVLLDTAYAELTGGCHVQPYTASRLLLLLLMPSHTAPVHHECPMPSLTTLIALYHRARLQLIDGVIQTDSNIKHMQYALVAEQEACLDAAYCTVYAGSRAAIRLQGGHGHLEHCHITGHRADVCEADTLAENVPGHRADLMECVGVQVELGGQLSAQHCLVSRVSVGVAAIAYSVADLQDCHVMLAGCGFLVDAATARLTQCTTSDIAEVCVQLQDGAKATVRQDTGSCTQRDWWAQCVRQYVRGEYDAMHAVPEEGEKNNNRSNCVLEALRQLSASTTLTLAQYDELLFRHMCTSEARTCVRDVISMPAVGPRCGATSHYTPTPVTNCVRRGLCGGACNVWLAHAELHACGLTLLSAHCRAVCAQAESTVRMQDCMIAMDSETHRNKTQEMTWGECGVYAVRSAIDLTRCFIASTRCAVCVTSATKVQLSECVAWRVACGFRFASTQAVLQDCSAAALCQGLCLSSKSRVHVFASPPSNVHSTELRGCRNVWQGMRHAMQVEGGSVLRASTCGICAGQCGVRVQDSTSRVTLTECDVQLCLHWASGMATSDARTHHTTSKEDNETDALTGDALLLYACAGLRLSSHTSALLTRTRIFCSSDTHETDTANVLGIVLVGQAAQLEAHHCTIGCADGHSVVVMMRAGYAAIAGAEMHLTHCTTSHSAGVPSCYVALMVCEDAKATLQGGRFAAGHIGLLCKAATVFVHDEVSLTGWGRCGLKLCREAYLECMSHSALHLTHSSACEGHSACDAGQQEKKTVGSANTHGCPATSNTQDTASCALLCSPACIEADRARALLRHVTLRGAEHRTASPHCVGLRCIASHMRLRRCRFAACLPCVSVRGAAQVLLQRCIFYTHTRGGDHLSLVQRAGGEAHVQQDACEVRQT